MKQLKNTFLVALTIVLLGCGSSKKVILPNAYLDEIIAQKTFEIKVSSAEPMPTQAWVQIANSGLIQPGNSPGRIDVTGSGYFLKVKEDSVEARLPYFGERQLGGGYNTDTGINFKGLSKDMIIEKDESKQSYRVQFRTSAKTEVYMVNATISANLNSAINIQSSHRTRIWYSGTIEETKTTETATKSSEARYR